jgi:hypothetical protein
LFLKVTQKIEYLQARGLSLSEQSPLFIILFYIDNRKQYTNTNKNKKYITKDIKKLITTLGIAEIGYLSTYAISAFTLLDGAQISITSTIPAWIVYIFMANIIIIKYCFL